MDQAQMIAELRGQIQMLEKSRQQFAQERERLVGMVNMANQAAQVLQAENQEIVAVTHGLLKMAVYANEGPLTIHDNLREKVARMVLEREDREVDTHQSHRIYTLRDMTADELAKYEAARERAEAARAEQEKQQSS